MVDSCSELPARASRIIKEAYSRYELSSPEMLCEYMKTRDQYALHRINGCGRKTILDILEWLADKGLSWSKRCPVCGK